MTTDCLSDDSCFQLLDLYASLAILVSTSVTRKSFRLATTVWEQGGSPLSTVAQEKWNTAEYALEFCTLVARSGWTSLCWKLLSAKVSTLKCSRNWSVWWQGISWFLNCPVHLPWYPGQKPTDLQESCQPLAPCQSSWIRAAWMSQAQLHWKQKMHKRGTMLLLWYPQSLHGRVSQSHQENYY